MTENYIIYSNITFIKIIQYDTYNTIHNNHPNRVPQNLERISYARVFGEMNVIVPLIKLKFTITLYVMTNIQIHIIL